MAEKRGKAEEYRRKKALEQRKKREKEIKKSNKAKKKINRPAPKPQPFKGERISPMDDVDRSKNNRKPLKDFFAFDEKKPKKKKKKKASQKIIHHDFLGENVRGSGVYEKREYIDKRKQSPKKKKGVSRKARLRMKIIAYIMIVAVVLVAGLTLSLTVFFKTESFKVTGETRYSNEEIIKASGLSLGENIFIADKDTASKNIINAFPYIAGADVSFSMPDTITIKVTEGKPSYQVQYGEKQYCTVSTEGRILNIVDKKDKNLPVIKGVNLKDATPGAYVEYDNDTSAKTLDEIVSSIENSGFDKLSAIDVSDSTDINFTYDKRILVKLGMPEAIDYKVRTAKTIITEKLDPNNTGVVEGTLDVSTCNETKRSYFNEKSIDEIGDEGTSSTEPTTASADGQYVDGGTYDSGAVDYGTYDSGAVDYGTYDSGAVDYGTYDSGAVDYGAYDSGAVDYGAYDSGAIDYGSYDNGAVDYGATQW